MHSCDLVYRIYYWIFSREWSWYKQHSLLNFVLDAHGHGIEKRFWCAPNVSPHGYLLRHQPLYHAKYSTTTITITATNTSTNMKKNCKLCTIERENKNRQAKSTRVKYHGWFDVRCCVRVWIRFFIRLIKVFEKMNGEKVYQIKLTANKNKFVYNCVCGAFILPC